MFRNRYPDSPNLFTRRLGEPYRPPLGELLRRSWPKYFVGAVLVAAGLAVLAINEGRAVSTTRSLDEGHRDLLVPETTSVVFEENNGKLVLVSGELNVDSELTDATYGIANKAVKLKKVVQMYQWYETADVKGVPSAVHEDDHDRHTETTYSYDKDWFDKRIDSESFDNPFGHHNPEAWPLNSSLVVNQRAKIGGFLLGKELKKKFDDFVTFTSDERPSNPQIKMHAGLYYHASNVWEPDVSDFRIQFSYAGKQGEKFTVVGRQAGREILPYFSESGSRTLLFIHKGVRSPSDVFRSEHAQNRIETYGLRMAGWFVVFIGLNVLDVLLERFVDDFPYVRRVLVLGVTSLPFSLSVSLTILSIGIGWIVYRPLFGLPLMALSSAPIFLAVVKVHRRNAAQSRHRL